MYTSDELLATLAEAVAVAFRELAGVEAAPLNSRTVSGAEGFADVSAVLAVTTPAGPGYFVLSFSDDHGTALAKRVLADLGADPEPGVIRDCLGEVVNVVAGQAKTLLYGTPLHFTLATPTVVAGAPALANAERLLVTFAGELGEFTLHVRLPA